MGHSLPAVLLEEGRCEEQLAHPLVGLCIQFLHVQEGTLVFGTTDSIRIYVTYIKTAASYFSHFLMPGVGACLRSEVP